MKTITDVTGMSEFFKALAHPIRLKVVIGLLERNDCDVNTISSNLKVPQPTVSQHLGLLKNKGIIGLRKDGLRSCYYVLDARVEAVLESIKK
jgi:ArsR family transcriptional regulator